jgi:predicted MPP superfamily phosphohydrolase
MSIKNLLIRNSFITIFISIIFYILMKKRFGNKNWFKFLSFIYFVIVFLSELIVWDYILFGGHFWIDAENIFLQSFYFIYIFIKLSLFLTFPVFLGFALYKIINYFIKKNYDFKNEKIIENVESSYPRKEFLKKSLLLTGGILEVSPAIGTLGFISTMIMGSNEIVTEKIAIQIPNLHSDLKGYKIIQISDIHIGPSISDKYLEYCLDIIRNLKADMVVITGDLIDISNYYIPRVGNFIYKLKSFFKNKIIFISGNHEYFDHGEYFFNRIDSEDILFLRNSHVEISRGKGRLNLIGLDYPWPHRMISPERILKSKQFYKNATSKMRIENPVILLNHDPADFIWLKDEAVDLVLSGHTHGGHVKFTDQRESILSPLSLIFKYYNGYYKEGKSQLYVNRGMGNTFPIRLKCPPEITLIELI